MAELARRPRGLTNDAVKVRSCVTLFLRADPAEAVFQQVLDNHFGGVPDLGTDRLLGA